MAGATFVRLTDVAVVLLPVGVTAKLPISVLALLMTLAVLVPCDRASLPEPLAIEMEFTPSVNPCALTAMLSLPLP